MNSDSISRWDVHQALETIASDAPEQEILTAAEVVVRYASGLVPDSVELTRRKHDKGSKVTGHTSEFGNVSFEYKRETERTEPAHELRIGNFRLGISYKGALTIRLRQGCFHEHENSWYIIFYDPASLRPLCVGEDIPSKVWSFRLFGKKIIFHTRSFVPIAEADDADDSLWSSWSSLALEISSSV